MSFADLGLSEELLRAVGDTGYTEPTPIQASAIPSVLMMRDIIGIAQTGTGKTASFVLPMIDILAHGRARALMPRSLILEPTRELAAQVAENFEIYGKYHKLSMALLIGGVQMGDQVKALEKGVDVLIATPGRLMDLFGRGKILLNGCSMLVIDEADRMLDMGFIPDIEEICTKLPKQRQTLLFSATMPPPIKKLADKFLANPKTIEVARPASTNINITQYLVPVKAAGFEKRAALRGLLAAEDVKNAIIFCNRKTTVRELNKSLKQHGYAAGEIHGDMEQPARIAELDRFKRGDINILVASDVAARGLDIKGVSHVFNFDAPWHPDDYVHRIGRTGRAGATGTAYTLVGPDDVENIENIEKLTGQKIARLDVPAAAPGAEAPPRERAPREERRPRESRAPRQEQRPVEAAPRAPRRENRAPPARATDGRRRREPDDGPDEGWNGPVPDFLSVTLGPLMTAWRYRLAGRAMKLWWRIARPRTFGVRALLVDSSGHIALVRHHYVGGWYLPGGGVDKRESAETAIRRELREEVGLTSVTVTGVLGIYHNAAEAKDDHVVVFTASVSEPAALIAADPREIAEAAWFAPDALPDGTSPATRRRIAEFTEGRQGFGSW